MKKLCLLLWFVLIAPVAYADGIYLGASIGAFHDAMWQYSSFTSKSENGFSYKAYGGYDFNKYVAFEAGYNNLGPAKFSHSDGSTGTLAVNAYTTSLKITPLQFDATSPFIKIGASYLTNQETWSDSTPRYTSKSTNIYWAIGAEYKVNHNLFSRIEYENFGQVGAFNRQDWTNNAAGVKPSSLTLGLGYKF